MTIFCWEVLVTFLALCSMCNAQRIIVQTPSQICAWSNQQGSIANRNLFEVFIKDDKRVSREVVFVKSSVIHVIYSIEKGRYWNDTDRKLVGLGKAKGHAC